MKSRHPHIFMRDESIKTVQDVNDFWETQKRDHGGWLTC